MKRLHTITRNAVTIAVAVLISVASNGLHAQDSTFLACARHSDRGDRIACLEDALDAALAAQERSQNAARPVAPDPAPAAVPAAPVQNPVASAPPVAETPPAPEVPAAAPAEPEERTSLLDRVRAFGQSDEDAASISTDESGKDRLHDTITALEKRNDLWTVTLSSGQVWSQAYPRTLNLRVGDEISIYQEGLGDGYRLATPRLNGFIRVERTK